jgi:hypothetical protein
VSLLALGLPVSLVSWACLLCDSALYMAQHEQQQSKISGIFGERCIRTILSFHDATLLL